LARTREGSRAHGQHECDTLAQWELRLDGQPPAPLSVQRADACNPMSYHNGSAWPHDTALAVAGLTRYAHVPGAVDLAHSLDAAAAFGWRLPELYCGFSRAEFAAPVPRQEVVMSPRLPASWGEVTVAGLRLGAATVTVTGLPAEWTSTPGR
jgi:hypothetical protein